MINFFHRLQESNRHVFWIVPCMLAPRLLGLMDRDPDSKTYGCVDRAFWRYKLHDIANARYQEAMFTLVLLHDLDRPENLWHRQPLLRHLIAACLRFWLANRHADGSLDEVYPFERSGCATAFSAHAATEVMLWDRSLYSPNVLSTAEWLAGTSYQANPNQRLAAALALVNFADLAGYAQFAARARDMLSGLAGLFGPRGCLLEYGGEDMGYHTISMSLLSQLVRRRPDWSEAVALLAQGMAAFDRNLDASGRIRPEAWSRGTQFVYPSSLATPGYETILDRVAQGAAAGVALTPLWLDDRYMIPLMSDYLLCCRGGSHVSGAGEART